MLTMHASSAAIAISTGCAGITGLLRAAPPHGYRSTDLHTLNASFLL
jgi:hypothetical protein